MTLDDLFSLACGRFYDSDFDIDLGVTFSTFLSLKIYSKRRTPERRTSNLDIISSKIDINSFFTIFIN